MKIMLFVFAFYPLLHTFWNADTPLVDRLFVQPELPGMLSDAEFALQQKNYPLIADRSIRARIIRDLAKSNRIDAFDAIERLFLAETDVSLRTDMLNTMAQFAARQPFKIRKPIAVRACLAAPQSALRAAAASLLLRTRQELNSVFDALPASDSFYRRTVFDALRANPDLWNVNQADKLLQDRNISAELRADLLCFTAAASTIPDDEMGLREVLVNEKINPLLLTSLVRSLASNPHSKGVLLTEFVNHAKNIPSVRLAAADTENLNHFNLLRRFAADPSAFTRAAAARSLENFNRKETFPLLAALICDPEGPVRTAAGNSLAMLTGKDIPPEILAVMNHFEARPQLLKAFRASKNPAYGPLALKILLEAKSNILRADAIAALDALNPAPYAEKLLPYKESKSAEVRRALASALARIPGDESCDAMKFLAFDKDARTAVNAMNSMRLRIRPDFTSTLIRALGSVSASSEFRAEACRTASAIPKMPASLVKPLMRLLLTPCIPVEKAPPAYDMAEVRACALMALFKASADSPSVKARFERALKHLKNPSAKEKENGFEDSALTEYLRQIELLEQGKTPSSKQIPQGGIEQGMSSFSRK